MQNKNNNVFTTAANRPLDPLARAALGRYARQVEMARFVRQIGKWLGKAVLGLTKSVADWNRRNALYRELERLPDYLLKDIGFRRDQIPAVVNNELRREDVAPGPTAGQAVAGLTAANSEEDSEKQLAA